MLDGQECRPKLFVRLSTGESSRRVYQDPNRVQTHLSWGFARRFRLRAAKQVHTIGEDSGISTDTGICGACTALCGFGVAGIGGHFRGPRAFFRGDAD